MCQVISYLTPWVPLVICVPWLPRASHSAPSPRGIPGQRSPSYCYWWNPFCPVIILWTWDEAIVRVNVNSRMCPEAGGADTYYRELTTTGLRELTQGTYPWGHTTKFISNYACLWREKKTTIHMKRKKFSSVYFQTILLINSFYNNCFISVSGWISVFKQRRDRKKRLYDSDFLKD